MFSDGDAETNHQLDSCNGFQMFARFLTLELETASLGSEMDNFVPQ